MPIISGWTTNASGQYGQIRAAIETEYAINETVCSINVRHYGVQGIHFALYGVTGYVMITVDDKQITPTYAGEGYFNSSSSSWAWVWLKYTNDWIPTPRKATAQTVKVYAHGYGKQVGGYGGYSGNTGLQVVNTFTIPAMEKPVALAGLSATGSYTNTHILSWNANDDSRTEGYRVYQTENGGSESLVNTVTSTTLTLGSRTTGATYTYRVVPYNVSGEGAGSSVTVYALTAAPSITLKTYTAPSTAVFTISNPNSFDASCAIDRSVDSGSSWATIIDTQTVTANGTVDIPLTSQPAGTILYRASFAAKSVSSTSSVTFMDIPSVPTSVGLTLSGNVFTGSWAVITSGANAAATVTYELVNSVGSIVVSDTIAATNTSVTYTGGTDTALKLRIRANNARGSSAYSAYTALVYNTLATPTIVVSSYTAPKTVVLSVTNNSVSNGSFAVEKSSNGSSGWTVLGSQSINSGVSKTFTDTDAYTPYSFYRARVTAPNTSAYTNPVSQQTIVTPSVPTNVSTKWSFSGTNTVVVTTWNESSTTNAPIDNVIVEVSTDNGSTWAVATTLAAGVKTFTQNYAAANQQRRYRVKTSNAAGASAYTGGNNVATRVESPLSLTNVITYSSEVPVSIYGGFTVGSGVIHPSLNATITLETSGGTALYSPTVYSNVVSGNSYTSSKPFFDPDVKTLGTVRWKIVYTSSQVGNPADNIVGVVTYTPTITKVAPIGRETCTFTEANTRLTVSGSNPYSCNRTITLKLWPYKTKWSFETVSADVAISQSANVTNFDLSEFMRKVPFVVYEVTITGKYTDGSTAYTNVLSGSKKKGSVLYLNGDIVRPKLILPDGTIQDVFPKVI